MWFGLQRIKKLGGINRELKVHEDLDLAKKLRRLGKLVYAPELKVKTSSRRYKKGFLSAILEYQINAIKVFLLGKKDASLRNIR